MWAGGTGHDVSPDRLGGNKLGPSVPLLDILRRARFPEQRKQPFRERRETQTQQQATYTHTHTHTHTHTRTHTRTHTCVHAPHLIIKTYPELYLGGMLEIYIYIYIYRHTHTDTYPHP